MVRALGLLPLLILLPILAICRRFWQVLHARCRQGCGLVAGRGLRECQLFPADPAQVERQRAWRHARWSPCVGRQAP